ncbi:MAG: efflux RND transporter periplasmic adaptor subunit, partial [Deltaproteobacteria bacterium]
MKSLRRIGRAWPVLVAALAFSLFGYRRWFAPIPVRTAAVTRGSIVREVRGVGRLESPSEVSLGFDVPGRILSVAVDQGARVRSGDVLARLDQDDATALLSVAQATRSASSTGVQTARAEVARALAALAQARTEARRTTDLFERGAVTAAERDAVVSRLAIADAEWRARSSATEQAARQVSVASGSVALQQVRIDRGVLRSPIDGIVLVRHREPGDVVAPGAPVLTVAASDRLWAHVWVDESALSVIAAGQAARIEIRSEPGRSFAGVVERIAPEADR